MPYRANKSRSLASRRYQQQRVRQQRIAILALGLLTILGLIGGGIWGLLQLTPNLNIPSPAAIADTVMNNVSEHTPVFTSYQRKTPEFDQFMKHEFGLLNEPSLLYYHNLDFALLANHSEGLFKNKLMPVLSRGEDTELKAQLESLVAEFPASKFKSHIYFYNPQTATSVEINGYDPVPAASVIKLPILLDYLLSLDENLITMETPLLYAEFHRAGGAGGLQYRDTGVNFAANDVAGQMIRISDNTCTNMMISYLGGTDAVNNRLKELGLVHTRIRNWLPDLTGTNTVSPYEMVTILYNIDRGPVVSELSRYNGIDILKSTHNRRLMVWTLPNEAEVAHKTGDIGTALGDSGIVYLPDGRRYYLSIQVERPFNDYSIRDLFHRASRMVYDHVAAQPAQPVLSPAEASQLTENPGATEKDSDLATL